MGARRKSNLSQDEASSPDNGMDDEELSRTTQRLRNEVAEMRQLQARQNEEVGRLNQLISLGKRGTTQRCHECDVNLVDLSVLTHALRRVSTKVFVMDPSRVKGPLYVDVLSEIGDTLNGVSYIDRQLASLANFIPEAVAER